MIVNPALLLELWFKLRFVVSDDNTPPILMLDYFQKWGVAAGYGTVVKLGNVIASNEEKLPKYNFTPWTLKPGQLEWIAQRANTPDWFKEYHEAVKAQYGLTSVKPVKFDFARGRRTMVNSFLTTEWWAELENLFVPHGRMACDYLSPPTE